MATYGKKMLVSLHPKYKSELCRHFVLGNCPFGERCHWAHGIEEVWQANASRQQQYLKPRSETKTVLCWFLVNQGACYRSSCPFAHSVEEVQAMLGLRKEKEKVQLGTEISKEPVKPSQKETVLKINLERKKIEEKLSRKRRESEDQEKIEENVRTEKRNLKVFRAKKDIEDRLSQESSDRTEDGSFSNLKKELEKSDFDLKVLHYEPANLEPEPDTKERHTAKEREAVQRLHLDVAKAVKAAMKKYYKGDGESQPGSFLSADEFTRIARNISHEIRSRIKEKYRRLNNSLEEVEFTPEDQDMTRQRVEQLLNH